MTDANHHTAFTIGVLSTAGRSRRLLVVEDSFLIAEEVRKQLTALGHTVIGPAATVKDAHHLVEHNTVDAAILDISLGRGATSEPIARHLQSMSIPFVFMTGHSSPNMLPPDLDTNPRLLKPVAKDEMRLAIESLLAETAGAVVAETNG